MGASVTSEPDHEVVSRWPAKARSVPEARHELWATLSKWGLQELADIAELVVSELVTNAVQHAKVSGREVETRLIRITDDNGATGLRIEVHDAGDGRPKLRRSRPSPPSLATRGRGLLLIDALVGSAHWGVSDRLGIGKLVWAMCFPGPGPGPVAEHVPNSGPNSGPEHGR